MRPFPSQMPIRIKYLYYVTSTNSLKISISQVQLSSQQRQQNKLRGSSPPQTTSPGPLPPHPEKYIRHSEHIELIRLGEKGGIHYGVDVRKVCQRYISEFCSVWGVSFSTRKLGILLMGVFLFRCYESEACCSKAKVY